MKHLFAAAVLALSLTSAHAMQEIRSGSWVAYSGPSLNGTPTCGMQISGGGRDFHAKYQATGDGNVIFFHMLNQAWRFGDGHKVPLVLGFDKNEMIKGTANTYNRNNISFVEFNIEGDLAIDFLREFGKANKMWIRFEGGNEAPWVADMTGSRNAMLMFSRCITSLPKPTKPFDDKPQATQPFDGKPSKKKDDGRI